MSAISSILFINIQYKKLGISRLKYLLPGIDNFKNTVFYYLYLHILEKNYVKSKPYKQVMTEMSTFPFPDIVQKWILVIKLVFFKKNPLKIWGKTLFLGPDLLYVKKNSFIYI